MEEKKKYYEKRLDEFLFKEKESKRKLRILGFSRLIVFVFIIAGIFMLLPQNLVLGILSIFISIIFFFLLIKKFAFEDEKHKHLEQIIQIIHDELDALDHKFSQFDPGNEFIDQNHRYSFDMDIFGEGSLFQYINRTVSARGKEKLAGLFQKETLESKEIIDRQMAIAELKEKNTLLIDFRASGRARSDSENDIQGLINWVNKPVFYIKKRVIVYLAYLIPILTLVSLALSFFIDFWSIALALYLGQLFLIATRIKSTNEENRLIGKSLDALKKYSFLLERIQKSHYKAKQLTDISDKLVTGKYSAHSSIKDLSKIVSAFDNRLNLLAALFLEGFLLWDIHCMIRLEKWKSRQGKHLEEWIDAIADFDVMTSQATYAFNNSNFIFPAVTNEVIFETKELGHVLIPENQRVCNDFKINSKGDFTILTGANMAGKSTFLRTVSTNLLLAMAGMPVCSKSFRFHPMPLFSSMRTSDSLSKNESYFYAELKRLKEMLDYLKSEGPLFIILDEILKGTNSIDKQKGSKAVLLQILSLQGTGIIATHDLELPKIENEYPERIQNKCFEIEIDNADISFDYKLLNGVTTKMNAALLMRQMGIIVD